MWSAALAPEGGRIIDDDDDVALNWMLRFALSFHYIFTLEIAWWLQDDIPPREPPLVTLFVFVGLGAAGAEPAKQHATCLSFIIIIIIFTHPLSLLFPPAATRIIPRIQLLRSTINTRYNHNIKMLSRTTTSLFQVLATLSSLAGMLLLSLSSSSSSSAFSLSMNNAGGQRSPLAAQYKSIMSIHRGITSSSNVGYHYPRMAPPPGEPEPEVRIIIEI